MELDTQPIRWDLSRIYKGLDDPKLAEDVERSVKMAEAFDAAYRGKLKEKLGDAIAAYRAIDELANKLFIWLHLRSSLDVTDEALKTKRSSITMRVTPVFAERLTFLEHEIVGLSDEDIERQASHPEVARHRPWIAVIRLHKPHLLEEKVEEALSKRSTFGPHSWSEYYDEMEGDLRFQIDGKALSLEETTHLLGEEPDAERRAVILKSLNDGLGGAFARFSAQTLWMIVGAKSVEDRERKHPHPMHAANLSNRIPDKVVEALHEAAERVAGPITRDWYRLKGEMLGLAKMRWSDRNAKLRFAERPPISYPDAFRTVHEAYRSFSPTLAALVEKMGAEKRIDAHPGPKRESGAYNYSGSFPGDVPESFVFMSYLGSDRDVMTLAHELGHAGHGLLAGEAQGSLMQQAPMAYAETASVFGEMTTFNHLLSKLSDDPKARLALLAGKIDDMMNTLTRQIGFSFFEREVHGTGRRLAPSEIDAVWLRTLKRFYGEDGDVFTYEDCEHLWAYIGHFHRPFYVYSYAFGELLTQSLYATREKLGDRFEPMYLDLLRAGGTKDAVELLKPFGLDPTDPNFWADGIKASMGKMVEDARSLWRQASG